jgi:hypothetical protein
MKSEENRAMNARFKRAGLLAMLAVVPLALTALGCKQEVLCPALGNCGGVRDPATGHSIPPYGSWALRPGHPSCTEDLYVPANDTRLGMAPLTPPGTPFPEPAVFDWCVLLITSPKLGNIQVRQPRFYYESGPIGESIVSYSQNGEWGTKVTRTGVFTLDFPAYCVRAFGAQDNRPAGDENGNPVGPPVDICKQLEVPVRAAGVGEGSYFNTVCERNPADPPDNFGCLCTFQVSETGGPAGKFFLQDDQTIVHLLDSGFPQYATFCQQGDNLQLTGTDGMYLFDQRGLRTYDLVKLCSMDSECSSGHCDVAAGNCI